MLDNILTFELYSLRDAFQRAGFDIRFVGGCVRDLLLKQKIKDIDLATDATPSEQKQIYHDAGIEHIPTGLQHGTWTVLLNHKPYEITSLRTESNHDGRHATVLWTRDWLTDLYRRDLTINAMSMTFDGELIDPFGGADDLKDRIVRFVGEPADRVKEDYLRILRFFRFHARIAGDGAFDEEALAAIQEHASGLAGISRERVWSEMSRIIGGRFGPWILEEILGMDIACHIDLPYLNIDNIQIAHKNTSNPVSILASSLNVGEIQDLATKWRWSHSDKVQGEYLTKNFTQSITLKDAVYKIAVDGHKPDWLCELFCIQGKPLFCEQLESMEIPKFPVAGRDLLEKGMQTGAKLGETLCELKLKWAASNYQLSKQTLLKEVKL